MSKPIIAHGEHCKAIDNIDRITEEQLTDWGVQENPLSGNSHSSGILLYKGKDNKPESGLWQCTPGTWTLEIPRDEFCHFTKGTATYTHDNGEIIKVRSGTCVHFKAGWKGTCEVHETIQNVYMLTA